ncbi:MAG TPA: hypothetical protein VJH06_02840 [Candidatus Paceibacterota bacterium]
MNIKISNVVWGVGVGFFLIGVVGVAGIYAFRVFEVVWIFADLLTIIAGIILCGLGDLPQSGNDLDKGIQLEGGWRPER